MQPETVNLGHIKEHYYGSHESINPSGIVPKSPVLDLNEPNDCGHLSDWGSSQRDIY